MPVRILVQGPARARVHASWTIVQRASIQENWRYSRFCKLDMDGGENSLVGDCKAYHKGGGYWLIMASTPGYSDIAKAITLMRTTWEQARCAPREQVSTPNDGA